MRLIQPHFFTNFIKIVPCQGVYFYGDYALKTLFPETIELHKIPAPIKRVGIAYFPKIVSTLVAALKAFSSLDKYSIAHNTDDSAEIVNKFF